MAKIEVEIPKSLGLTKKELTDLEKAFQKHLVDTLKNARTPAKSKSKQMVVDVRAKSKSQIV